MQPLWREKYNGVSSRSSQADDRDSEGTSKKRGKSPLKLLSSSFSALARFEVGREPARALRLRDSMRSVCLVGGFGSSLFGFTKLDSPLTKPATTSARSGACYYFGLS